MKVRKRRFYSGTFCYRNLPQAILLPPQLTDLFFLSSFWRLLRAKIEDVLQKMDKKNKSVSSGGTKNA